MTRLWRECAIAKTASTEHQKVRTGTFLVHNKGAAKQNIARIANAVPVTLYSKVKGQSNC